MHCRPQGGHLGFRKLFTKLDLNFIGRICIWISEFLLKKLTLASVKRVKKSSPEDCYNLFLSLQRYDMIFPQILLRGFLYLMATMQLWWWYNVSLNNAFYANHSPLYSNFLYLQYLMFHGMPSSIVTNRDPTFTSDFWKNYLDFKEPHCNIVQPIIHSLMAKLKLSINVWSNISGV